jgi:predicted RNase H-like nuclease (RuvC/YqgF family)
MEARRDQIQELEKNLQQDKERIETIAAQLQSNQDDEQQSAIASSNEDS